MLKIGEFATLACISIRMLRHYDELDLLKPAMVDRESGYRYYTLEQLPRLNRIIALKDLGLSLEEIRLLLNENLSADEIRGMLKLKQAQLAALIQEEQARLRRVENRLRDIENEGKLPENEVVMKPFGSLHVISLREYLQPGTLIPALYRVVYQALVERNLDQHRHGSLTIYHNSLQVQHHRQIKLQRPPSERLIEACFLVDAAVSEDILLPDERRLHVWNTPAFPQVASIVTASPDGERHLDYQAMWRWMDVNHYRIYAPVREIHHKRPIHNNEYLTEILFPIEPVEE